MSKVSLNPKQLELRKIIEENLKTLKKWEPISDSAGKTAFENMSKAAHKLHMSLEPKPKHRYYM